MHEVAIDWSTAQVESHRDQATLNVSFTVQPDVAWFNHFHYEVVIDERRRPRNLGNGRVQRNFSQSLHVSELDTKTVDAAALRKRCNRLVAKTNQAQKEAWNRTQAAADKKRRLSERHVQSRAAELRQRSVGAEGADSGEENEGRLPVTMTAPRVSGAMTVELTRTELVALKEAIAVTPVFEGRTNVREAIQEVLHQRQTRPAPLCIEEHILTALMQRIVPIDTQTAALRSKLSRALQRESLRSHP